MLDMDYMTAKQKQVNRLMNNLGISAEEAESLIEYDKEVDKMTNLTEVKADLTAEQQKAVKKATITTTGKPQVRERKDEVKFEIMQILEKSILKQGANCIEILNPCRELTFLWQEKKYRLTLAQVKGGK